MSRSSTCLTIAFHVACKAPAPMTISTMSGVSCAWVVTPVFCLLVPVRAAGKNYCAAGKLLRRPQKLLWPCRGLPVAVAADLCDGAASAARPGRPRT